MGMVSKDDIVNTLQNCKPQIIFFCVVAVLAIAVIIGCRKMSKAKKYVIRWNSVLAIFVALVAALNMIAFGPMSTLIGLATTHIEISDETTAKAEKLGSEIAGEGIVLLKNENNLLPLNDQKNLNVFGWASTNPAYGGTGSGSLSDSYEVVSLLQGLKNAGINTNTELSDFYTEYRSDKPEFGVWEQEWTLPEPPVDTYTDNMLQNAKDFSDTAMIVLSRTGGENLDLAQDMSAENISYTDNSSDYKDFPEGTHYMELSQTEKNLVDMVCSNFDNVIVVYNGANTLELGWVNDYAQIGSVLWCPGPGQTGFNALGEILTGEINPSAKSVDTFVTDVTKVPSSNNIGNFQYEGAEEFAWTSPSMDNADETSYSYPHFVNYVEGIYVGYRFYETAYEEAQKNTGWAKDFDYDETVLYPFGYGLSYTSFEQKMGDLKTDNDGNISFDVTVTNTGDVAGKDVVEVYYTPPYTNGGIEKASVNLLDFAKTGEIQPGESETVSFSFNEEDMASYDMNGEKCYVLEDGDYDISVRTDSHHVVDHQTYHVDGDVVYNEENPRSTDETAATNQFDYAAGEVTYLSRKDGFENYEEATAAPTDYTMSDYMKENFTNFSNYNPEDYNNPDDEMPVTGAKNGVELLDLRGVDYDDPKWDDLLDELTVDEMRSLIGMGGYQTLAIDSVNKVATIDCDGPAALNSNFANFTGVGSIGFPCEIMIGNTWNRDMALSYGEMFGEMADEMGVSGWYAPGVNIHRNPFSGRNFEYYSEDSVLSGEIAAQAVIGAANHGVYAYVKHFALNDQETNRYGMLATWCNEQAMREVYLKPFEIAVKKGHATAMMSAYNYIGDEWAGATTELQNTVLRDEWGFRGMVVSDYFGFQGFGYMDADKGIRGGTDMNLTANEVTEAYPDDTNSATGVLAMRQASKNILYTVVNSRAYGDDVVNAGPAAWKIALGVVDGILFVILVLIEVFVVRRGYLKRSNQIRIETEENVTDKKEE